MIVFNKCGGRNALLYDLALALVLQTEGFVGSSLHQISMLSNSMPARHTRASRGMDVPGLYSHMSA